MIWVFFALFGALFAGIAAIIQKKALLKEHAMEFSAVLAIFNFLITLLLLPRVNFDIPLKILLLTIFASLFGSIAFLYFAKALRHSEVSVTTSIMNFKPALIVFLAFIFLKESLKPYQIFWVFLLIIGAYVLEIKHKNEKLSIPFKHLFKSKSSHYLMLSLLFYAVSSIMDKIILNYLNPETYIFLVHTFIAIIFLTFLIIFHNGVAGIKHGISTSWRWIALVALLVSISRLFQAYSLSLTNLSLFTSIKNTSTIFSIILSGHFFHEQNLKQKLIAATIMVIGATIIVLTQ